MVELNNIHTLNTQMTAVAEFYSHPVWILKGLFSEYDLESNAHRKAIAQCIKKIQGEKIADYGSGSGVLARDVAEELPMADVQIIEPYSHNIFVERLKDVRSVKFVGELGCNYDVLFAQDILEYIDNPINLAVDLI